jgi:hypothetical protein
MFRYALLSLAFLSSPALAAGFQAQTTTAPSPAPFVARDSIWRCAGTQCVSTNRTSTRAAIVCAALARQVGALRGFAVDGRPFDARQLESCNGRAR